MQHTRAEALYNNLPSDIQCIFIGNIVSRDIGEKNRSY